MWFEAFLMASLMVPLAFAQGPAAVVTIGRGSLSGVADRREVVVRSPAEWNTLWQSHAGADAKPPAVDFGQDMVVAVFLGTKPTGGFAVEIVRTHLEADVLVVEYTERRPGPDASVTQALTAPFHIVRMKRHAGAVRFSATVSVRAAGG